MSIFPTSSKIRKNRDTLIEEVKRVFDENCSTVLSYNNVLSLVSYRNKSPILCSTVLQLKDKGKLVELLCMQAKYLLLKLAPL